MADAIVSSAIQKLGEFLIKEVNIRIGVKDDVRWLKEELGYLQSSVRYAEAKQETDQRIVQWINNVRYVANEAVIILERFSQLQEEHEAPKQGILDRLWSFICMCKKEANLYDIGKEIESLKGRVVEIKNRRYEYNISNILATTTMQERKRTVLRATSFQNLVDVVGFEDDFKTSLAFLDGRDPSRRVISIHGMGGLGKSTLAGKLYHSNELSHIKYRAWVCVSEDYDIKDVLKKIIKCFEGYKVNLLNFDVVDLLRHLRDLLLDCDCYLVVIDDIWDIKVWNTIKEAFPDKKNGRIIITTRNKDVGEGVNDGCLVHPLRFLREDESWQLFCKRANPSPNLVKVGKEMVSKCRGLPLAIIVLSGLLLHKKSYEDWSNVKEHLWRMLKGKSSEIQEILSLSFDDLPFELRNCFLYLARFPEDHFIEVDKLKLLWVAEEFISEAGEGDGVVMEDVTEDYLNELVNRNMIQVLYFHLNGKVMLFRVHDLVRDLAIQKATERKLLGIFDSSKEHSSQVRLLQGQPRHAIINGMGEYLKLLGPSSSDDLKLRSLALVNGSGTLEPEEVKLMYTRFNYLKVLDLNGVESEGLPKEIWNLVLLKFLGLIVCEKEGGLVIPPTICKLKKLQTLYGSDACIYGIPTEIYDLKELRHLNINFFYLIGEINIKIGSHPSKLQTLRVIEHSEWNKFDTVNFTNLRTLDIIKFGGGDPYTLDSIGNLTSLQTFTYFSDNVPTLGPLSSCKSLKSVVLQGAIKDPLELTYLPDSVTHVELMASRFRHDQDPMPALGSLPNLTSLYLQTLVYYGEKIVCHHDSFPSLQFLKLEYLDVKEWQVDDGAMPSLGALTIRGCENLKMLPSRMKELPPIPCIYYGF